MDRKTGEPKLASFASWLVLIASFGLSASTWIALGVLAGFTGQLGFLRLAWLLPLAVDGYLVVALVVWMSDVPQRVARFARTNTYVAATIGVAAQAAFHALTIWTGSGTLWRAGLAAIVGALPPGVAALAVHLRALLRRENGREEFGIVAVAEPVVPVVDLAPAPVKLNGTPVALPLPGIPAKRQTTGNPGKRGPVATTADHYEAARQKIRADETDGKPVTGRHLAERHGKSERWWRERLKEVRQQEPAMA